MKLIITKKGLADAAHTLLILLILLSPFIRVVLGLFPYLIAFGVMIITIMALFHNSYHFGNKVIITSVLIGAMFSLVILTEPANASALFYAAISLVSLLLAYWVIQQNIRKISLLALTALALFYIFFLFSMFKHGYGPDDVNNYFSESSRNIVSATVLFYQILYSSSYFRSNNKLPLITPVFTVLICVIAYGRTGIALSVALLIFTYLYEFWKSKIIYKIPILVVSVGLILFLVQNILLVDNFVHTKTNFALGIDTPRIVMIQQYVENLTLTEILIGRDLASVPIIHIYSDNPHNSFIYSHSQFGILYIILLAWIFFSILWYCMQYKSAIIYSALLFLFIVRLSLDTLSFFGVFDILFYCVLMMIYFRPSQSKAKNEELKIKDITHRNSYQNH